MAKKKEKLLTKEDVLSLEKVKSTIEQFVDYLLTELTPYESSIYLYLLRNSYLRHGDVEFRVGIRTIAKGYGRGSRGEKTNYTHISETLRKLEQKGCIKVGDTNIHGTLYKINLPQDIPLVAEKMLTISPRDSDDDYFSHPHKRRELFERDGWICQYCGEKVGKKNATLDHFIPRSKEGDNSKDNLRTCCLVCNGIKSGKTYEEAAPLLLRSIRERRARLNNA